MSSFTFCDSLILCVISLFALFILWRIRFFKPGAKIKNKFLDKQMSYGLKCEMIIKKLSSPNSPPPHFCNCNCCFIGLVFRFFSLL